MTPTDDNTTDGPVRFDAPKFLHAGGFDRDWADAGLTDSDLQRLQVEVGTDPEAGDVMAGTDGLRKVRYAKPGKGKSGGVRVCYAVYAEFGVIHLYTVFQKNEKSNLNKDERNAVAGALAQVREKLTAEKAAQDAANAGG